MAEEIDRELGVDGALVAEPAVTSSTPLLSKSPGSDLYRAIPRRSENDGLVGSEDVENANSPPSSQSRIAVYATLSVLLIGVFISQANYSLVLATYGHIGSEFDQLDAGSWLISAYVLAACVVQPLYGKLSDIFGRKPCLQASYVLFVLGTAGCGLGRTMIQVIASRALQGAGGAGMVSMVSIVITDLVPVQEVASVWSYMNVLQTTGRGCGGVIGGLLTQVLGWRWAFLIQIPPMILAILLVQWRLSLEPQEDTVSQDMWAKLRRIDFAGALLLALPTFSICFALDMGGQKLPWGSPIMIANVAIGSVSALAFVLSTRWAVDPIFPLRILGHRDVVTNYLLVMLQMLAQMALMMAVPLYAQAIEKSSTAGAGAFLIPAFVGNTLGGLASGYWIQRTGRYKIPTVLAAALALICATLCLLTWNGRDTIAKSVFILPGGAAAGMAFSSAFVSLAAEVDEDDIAVASSGMYLFFNLGAVAGSSLGAAVFQSVLGSQLDSALPDTPEKSHIITHAVQDMNYVQNAAPQLRRFLVPAFIEAFHGVNILGIAAGGCSLLLAMATRNRDLKKDR